MKNVIILLFLLYLTSIKAMVATGAYSCPINFPTGAYEALILEFNGKIDQPVFLENASQTLPNLMLVNVDIEDNQSSIRMSLPKDTEYKEAYQIYWKDSWYHGSTLRIFVKSFTERGFKADIEFDDNDGLTEILKSNCTRTKSSKL